MLLNNWYSFNDMGRTLSEVDRLFNAVNRPLGVRSVPRGTFPAINVYDQGERTTVIAEVPGVDPKKLELTVLDDTLTLRGERVTESKEGERYYRRERLNGSFNRTVSLPAPVDPDTVKAEYKHGVLKVILEKAVTAKPRQIPILS